MNGLLILAGLIAIGLLIALVVLSALMLGQMKTLTCISEELKNNSIAAQAKLEAGQIQLATALAPMAPVIASQQLLAKQQSQLNATPPPPPPPPL